MSWELYTQWLKLETWKLIECFLHVIHNFVHLYSWRNTSPCNVLIAREIAWEFWLSCHQLFFVSFIFINFLPADLGAASFLQVLLHSRGKRCGSPGRRCTSSWSGHVAMTAQTCALHWLWKWTENMVRCGHEEEFCRCFTPWLIWSANLGGANLNACKGGVWGREVGLVSEGGWGLRKVGRAGEWWWVRLVGKMNWFTSCRLSTR